MRSAEHLLQSDVRWVARPEPRWWVRPMSGSHRARRSVPPPTCTAHRATRGLPLTAAKSASAMALPDCSIGSLMTLSSLVSRTAPCFLDSHAVGGPPVAQFCINPN